jgi:hypothetical protein
MEITSYHLCRSPSTLESPSRARLINKRRLAMTSLRSKALPHRGTAHHTPHPEMVEAGVLEEGKWIFPQNVGRTERLGTG